MIRDITQREGLAAMVPTPAELERLLREKYEPILDPDTYARLREKCGLGQVFDGETTEPAQPTEEP